MIQFNTLRKALFFLLLLSTPLIGEQHKIVFLISTPRSCSTAFMRMMEATDDFFILHEPTIYPYTQNNEVDKEITKGWFTDKVFQSFDDVKSTILEESQKKNVFVKEISFFLHDFLADEDLVSNPNIHFVFLIRNPHNAIISYYKKYMQIVPNFSFFVGCRSSWEIYEKIKDKVKNPITIVSSEELCGHPTQTAQHLFNNLSMPFKPDCLQWKDLGNNFTGEKEWNEVKTKEKLYHWHENAIRSTCFVPLPEKPVDENGLPTFEEIENLQDRQECLKMYNDNIFFYNKLINEKM